MKKQIQRGLAGALALAALLVMPIMMTTEPSAADTAMARWSLSGTTLTVTGAIETGNTSELLSADLWDNVQTVVLGPDITTISPDAFYGLNNLTSVEIQGTVTSIGSGAFSGCKNLRQYGFSEGLTSIGDYAFSGCSALFIADKTLPSTVSSIGLSAFDHCSSLDLESLPSPAAGLVLGTGAFAYSGLASLHEVAEVRTISETMTEETMRKPTIKEGIPPKCFEGSGLTNITIHNATIGQEAFSFCKGLERISMVEAQNIGWRAFACDDLLTIRGMPETLKYLGGGAFYGCKKVSADRLPSTMASDWGADNFLGTGWDVIVEIYVQNDAMTQYNLWDTRTINTHALWLTTLDTSGETPVITITDEGANAALDGKEIEEVYQGAPETYDAEVLAPLPDLFDYKLRHDPMISQRINTATEPVTIKIYYDRIEAVFSATVPTAFTLYQDEMGVVTTGDNAKIINFSNRKLQVTDVSMTPAEGWTIKDNDTYDPTQDKMDEKNLSMTINGESTLDVEPYITYNADNWPLIMEDRTQNGEALDLSYTAKVSPQSKAIKEVPAHVTFRLKLI